MSFRSALLLTAILLANRAVANDKLPPAPCHQAAVVGRMLWLKGAMEVPPSVATLMVNVIDGKLAQVRRQLKGMPPIDERRWRQSAFITAVYAEQSGVAAGLLDDGADVNGKGWMPAYKPDFFGNAVTAMKHDPRFGGPGAVDGMAKTGLLENQGRFLGPALSIAASCSDVATVDVLLRHHPDVMARQAPNVEDALEVATLQGNAAIVRRLLDHGATSCIHDRRLHEHMRNDPALRERMLTAKRDFTLAAIGRRAGLPAGLTGRLICPIGPSTH